MKKYILPLVLLVALMGHLGYNLLHTDQFVFDTTPVLKQAEIAAQQHVLQQPTAIHPTAGISTLAESTPTTAAAEQPLTKAD